jgi:hypothetical protein
MIPLPRRQLQRHLLEPVALVHVLLESGLVFGEAALSNLQVLV